MNVDYTEQQLNEAADHYIRGKASILLLHEGLENVEQKALLAHKKAIDQAQDEIATAILREYDGQPNG